MKIVLIEKDQAFAETLSRILETEGYSVFWSREIEQALAQLHDTTVSAAILDIHDGSEVKTEHVKAVIEKNSDIPLLVTTSYQTPELAYKALGAGAEDFLLKPFGTGEILSRLRRLVNRDSVSSETEKISNVIRSLSDFSESDNILQFCLDQLRTILHISDSLIAVRDDGGYRVVASEGYSPDPVSRKISVSEFSEDQTEVIRSVLSQLGLHPRRPFPILIPFYSNEIARTEPLGFVMGHGALILENIDLLEIERFISEIGDELASAKYETNPIFRNFKAEREGSAVIPDTLRIDAVTQMLSDISDFLSGEHDLFWIRLAVDEAINNAIMHGNGDTLENPQKPVNISWSIGSGKLVVVVEDHGTGFDIDAIPNPTSDENLMSVNGRGIFLMRTVMDMVIYNQPGNVVNLVKKLDGKPINVGHPADDGWMENI